jgi:hypothetical protein
MEPDWAALPLLAVAGALAAPTAGAKGPDAATLCGAQRCLTIHGERAVAPLLGWQSTGFSERAAPQPAPYYTLRVSDRSAGIRWGLVYVPRRHAMRIWQNRIPPYDEGVGVYWRTLPAAAEPAFRAVLQTLRPHAAPRRWASVSAWS